MPRSLASILQDLKVDNMTWYVVYKNTLAAGGEQLGAALGSMVGGYYSKSWHALDTVAAGMARSDQLLSSIMQQNLGVKEWPEMTLYTLS